VGSDIHAIVGATLSARAATRGVRRALALYEVLVRSGR
jgi:Na+-translocating ferredoxin:NAD+ oxidoreductase RnfG subunit